MAKAVKPSKKKAATKSPKKKNVAAKKTVKKVAPKKKQAKKKASKKAVKKIPPRKSLRRTASRPISVDAGTEPESVEIIPEEPKCKCKEKNGVFFLLVKQKNGKYKESPFHSPFETLAECEANCTNE
ncbi:hypothetical protein WG954_09865 [Lacibacter sp. H375]|uniref:hypothetical protein n=1 Tax=Lacibacter sp. H375 TaxID=3133424 RepID=UPI0030C4B759